MPNTTPIFTLTPNNSRTTVTTANTTRDLSSLTNASLLVSGGTSGGTRIDTIEFNHVSSAQTQASVAAVGRIWLCTSAGGANPKLKREIALTLITPSATVIGATFTMTFSPPLILNSGEFLWTAISATQTNGGYDVICSGGDF
jgi:hypothetical protein